MVAAYESTPNGEKGALLRREGLHSWHIIEWTQARDAGLLGKPTAGNQVPGQPRLGGGRRVRRPVPQGPSGRDRRRAGYLGHPAVEGGGSREGPITGPSGRVTYLMEGIWARYYMFVNPPVDSATADRATQWSEIVGDVFGAVPKAIGRDAAVGMVSATTFGPLSVFSIAATAQVIRGTTRTVRRQPDDLYKIGIPLDGPGVMTQDDRQVHVSPGQMVLYESGRPFEWALGQPWSCAAITFTPDALLLPHRVLQRALHHPYAIQGGPGAVLADFVSSALRQGPPTGAAAGRIGEAGLHLIAGALGAELPEDDATADAQRAKVLYYVRAHLSERDLTHGRVAAAHQMASRTLNRLFEHELYTVTEYIRLQRLEAARRDLADPTFQHLSIARVAARWGFPSPAHFTRAFQAQYGVAPSTIRPKVAQRQAG